VVSHFERYRSRLTGWQVTGRSPTITASSSAARAPQTILKTVPAPTELVALWRVNPPQADRVQWISSVSPSMTLACPAKSPE
jgi:hypothetical protein